MTKHITFLTPKGEFEHTEVMRITRDGVFVNPNVAVDDVAKTVLDALDDQIKLLVQKAVEAEREACAALCDKEANREELAGDETLGARYGAYCCAGAIRERGAP